MRQDLAYALRTFRKNPGFAAVVVASIALGIAANTTMFSIVNGLLFGSLPVRESSRLVSFGGGTMSWRDYADFHDGAKDVFEGVAAHFPIVPASIGGRGEPERVWGQLVTANYFDVVGASIPLGRGFAPHEDEADGRNPVVVLSEAMWRRRFGEDRDVIGRDIVLNGTAFKVIGVARPGFRGTDRGLVSEFWAPLSMMGQLAPDLADKRIGRLTSRTSRWLMVTARLRPGVTLERASAAVNVVQGRIDDEMKRETAQRRPMVLSEAGGLLDGMGTKMLPLMAVLMTVVGLVLLIACANVANVLLARASARQKEIGVRLAVGASRARLLRQLLTESMLLSVMGGAVGFLLASWAARGISAFRIPLPIPIELDFTPDLRVFAFTAAVAVVSGILFGLAPPYAPRVRIS
jgi:predicted permease